MVSVDVQHHERNERTGDNSSILHAQGTVVDDDDDNDGDDDDDDDDIRT